MNIKNTVLAILFACMLPLTSHAKEILIGASMAVFDDNWQTILRHNIQRKVQEAGAKIHMEDAKGDVAQQLQQVQNFIGQGVDAIIIVPVDTDAVQPIIKVVDASGIPLVFVNRDPQAALGSKMAYVGSDSQVAGQLQMEALAKSMDYKGNVAILLGELSNESTRERTKGVKSVIAKYPDIRIVEEQTAKWSRNEAVDLVTNWLTTGKEINAIASNNDEMAIGALQALGRNSNNILVAGVDGTPDALQFIKNGKMVATVFQSAQGQGEGAVDTAMKLIGGEKVESAVLVPFELITKDNYQEFASRNTK
ncbi:MULTISPECIES: sugar ABC transporter substrate-binding protein [unclassified Brenneria]|uniref:sugar ABC transporter substrate-binding protein n=1 Tax=unclassified Brenneria TaxID=2634434 RepID=UPI00155553EE|nr:MULTISPECIES: sugar ABC transporter substrate-binding protein [unclassified Brenneria]MBJ7223922.1 sugar ABC transporter substrate-binding protein [Brenneria sp. L3-3C-1]MEE3645166.1 sugar ABC transporter substrate-binding protein [Brenneria sp. L3_3C_1]MEE3649951.1 sugar ABC transporter substrate-binding protein [Brenneria sp. HEZEL_4_2_4]NPC99909.1 sugar ABC transporter substrate-binding protein [Brenneria sp. hezel4-2-4]